MSLVCDICGKRPSTGNRISRRGMAKKKGGVGKKIGGISRRWWKPNIQKVRAMIDGKPSRIRVCTGCLGAGKVIKPPVKLKVKA